MLSRRRFLQSNLAGITWPLVKASPKGAPAPMGRPAAEGTVTRDYWKDWPDYLTAKVNEARARRKAALDAIRSPEQVRERIEAVRRKVWELIGGPLEKSPLNPSTAGTLERRDYRIEKVIFESLPQVYVTAHLYIPKAGQPPFPAVLAPLGHTREGKAYRNYQVVYQTLARKGYVVLAFDPFGQGERAQYLDPRTGRSRLGPTGEHSQAGRPLLLLGATFAQYRVWDGIRALDYLLTRPEVDPERVGCTGHSGGGTMTMYLCALEPRIQVAVESEGNSENFAGPHYDPPGAIADAEQNLIGSLEAGIDRGDLLWAFAPRPLLIQYNPLDAGTTYSPRYPEGNQEIFSEVRRAYAALDAADRLQIFASPLPHDYGFFNRRTAYSWFNQWLAKKDLGTEEAEFESSPEKELNCTATGQVLTSLGGRSLVEINRDRLRSLESAREPQIGREEASQRLKNLLALPSEKTPLESRVISSNVRRDETLEEFEFRSEPQVRVPGWLIKPTAARPPLPTVVSVTEGGRGRVVGEPGEMDEIVRQGYAVCAMDLRGLGVSSPRYPAAGPLFYHGEHFEDGYAWACLTLGRPVLGQRVWDLLRCLDYLESRADLDSSRVYLLGTGRASLAALLGALLDRRPRSILLENFPADLGAVVKSEEYSLRLAWYVFGILRQFDIPELVASLAPRPCWLLNGKGAEGETLPASLLRKNYEAALRTFSTVAGGKRLQFLVQPDEERLHAIASWLENT